MPAYHSSFNEGDYRSIGNIFILPLKTKTKGPAPLADSAAEDIVDEAISLFRANCFFRNFEIKGNADRLLIYGILFVSECLGKINRTTSAAEASKILTTLAVGSFSIPGDAGFPLNSLYQTSSNRQEADQLRQYLIQMRQEIVSRLIEKLYPTDDKSSPSKWWMCFQKRKFMNKSL